MAILNSHLMINPVPFRGVYDGQEFELTGAIKIPVGKVLTDGDILKFVRLGENVRVDELILSCDGDLDPSGTALAGGIGYLQVLDSAGNALVVDNKAGTSYTSPSSAPFAYVATGSQPAGLTSVGVSRWVDGQSGLDNEFATNVGFTTGVVDIAIEITATGTAVATTPKVIRLTVKGHYKESPNLGEFPADPYRYLYNTDGSNGGLVS